MKSVRTSELMSPPTIAIARDAWLAPPGSRPSTRPWSTNIPALAGHIASRFNSCAQVMVLPVSSRVTCHADEWLDEMITLNGNRGVICAA